MDTGTIAPKVEEKDIFEKLLVSQTGEVDAIVQVHGPLKVARILLLYYKTGEADMHPARLLAFANKYAELRGVDISRASI